MITLDITIHAVVLRN